MTPICFLDTETDGVHPDRKVWEIAMIRRDEQGERETSFFVDIDLTTADPFGLKVGRYYDRHPMGRYLSGVDSQPPRHRESQTLYEASAALTVARWTHGAHIVGAVPNFDTEVLAMLLRRNGHLPAWHYHLIDIENLAVGYLAGQRVAGVFDQPADPEPLAVRARRLGSIAAINPPWKSDDLSDLIGVEPPSEAERHTALGDARWAMRVYDKIVGRPASDVDQVDIIADGRVIRSEAA
ncbi:hypothetical protein [Nocardia sp. NPDC051833]|uniref:hypothetical protein n=1 Tax=Nocardia sp. NPDC051833 TaxID=3155674 RepID=UPI00344794B0